MRVSFRKIDRTNWREAIEIKVHEAQENFVSPPVKTLAAAYVRQYGDEYDYAAMGIYDGNAIVGYVSTVCDSATDDEYWIDDIMIDARHQGKGYGRAAVAETIRHILRTYPRCEAIKLSCHRSNHIAERLYRNLGFEPTGEFHALTGEPNYKLNGERLREYR